MSGDLTGWSWMPGSVQLAPGCNIFVPFAKQVSRLNIGRNCIHVQVIKVKQTSTQTSQHNIQSGIRKVKYIHSQTLLLANNETLKRSCKAWNMQLRNIQAMKHANYVTCKHETYNPRNTSLKLAYRSEASNITRTCYWNNKAFIQWKRNASD